tara:strand:- start:1002 stop:2540 length:1539 start_codon:yes stop_codon:yes gene_type:complete
MTSLWEEANVEINHPGMKELQQGDMEERTENILYPTKDDVYRNAVIEYYYQVTRVRAGNESVEDLLKYLYTIEDESKVRKGINNIIRSGGSGIPKHNHLRQVDGAAEVYSLIGGEVDKRSITYEKIREQSVETMRENPTYQFCMLLAGFNNDKMDKYWITPSEIMLKKGKRRKIDPQLDRSSEGDKLSKEIVSLETELRALTISVESIQENLDTTSDIKFADKPWKVEALQYVMKSVNNYFGNIPKDKRNDMKLRKIVEMLMEYIVTNFTENNWFDKIGQSKFINKKIKEASEQADSIRYDSGKGARDLGKLSELLKRIEKIKEEIKNKKKARRSYSHLSNPQGFHNWYTSTAWADGRLHLSPLIYAHIEEAYNVVRRKWVHLKDVPLNMFIESPDVRSYFARLVAWCMRTSDCLSGKRFHLQSTYARVNHEKNKLLNIFRHVVVSKDKLLYSRNPDAYPFVMGTQTNVAKYLDDKQTLGLLVPKRPVESDIIRNMMGVRRAMTLTKAYNNM